MINKWKTPLNIMSMDKWLNLGKDIWSMIFKLCIGENIEEYNKYVVVIIRCTCKRFSQILTPRLCLQAIYDDPKANTAKYISYIMDITNRLFLGRYDYGYISLNDDIFHKWSMSDNPPHNLIRMRNKYRGRMEYFLQLKLKWCSDNGINKIYRAPGEHLIWKEENYFRKHKLFYGLREFYINPYCYLLNW